MKFEYNTPDTETRECVAYIDGDGDLMIRTPTGKCIWMDYNGNAEHHRFEFNPDIATHKFYRGDSVTITF